MAAPLRRLSYRAKSWDKARRVVAKVEWHPSELFPRVGFIVTNLSRPAERVTLFYNQPRPARPCAEAWTRRCGRSIVRVSHRRYVTFQLAEVAVRELFLVCGPRPGCPA